jgi:hypothetical protein
VSILDQAAIITASAVGGGSMIYSNVTIAPPADVLTEIGLSLSDADLAAGTAWMADFRGPLSRVVTKVPLPGRDVSSLAPRSRSWNWSTGSARRRSCGCPRRRGRRPGGGGRGPAGRVQPRS